MRYLFYKCSRKTRIFRILSVLNLIKVLQMSLISYNQKSISNLTGNDYRLSTIHKLNACRTFYVEK